MICLKNHNSIENQSVTLRRKRCGKLTEDSDVEISIPLKKKRKKKTVKVAKTKKYNLLKNMS